MDRNSEAQLATVFPRSNKRQQLKTGPSTMVPTCKSGTITQRGKDRKNDGIPAQSSPLSAERICVVRDAEAKEMNFEIFSGNLQPNNCTINLTVNNIERSSSKVISIGAFYEL